MVAYRPPKSDKWALFTFKYTPIGQYCQHSLRPESLPSQEKPSKHSPFFPIFRDARKRNPSTHQKPSSALQAHIQNSMLGLRIALLRVEKCWSQAELAKRIGVSTSAVGMYEQGRREPSLMILVHLARELDVTTDYLLTGKCNN